jgi:hypothetical protein
VTARAILIVRRQTTYLGRLALFVRSIGNEPVPNVSASSAALAVEKAHGASATTVVGAMLTVPSVVPAKMRSEQHEWPIVCEDNQPQRALGGTRRSLKHWRFSDLHGKQSPRSASSRRTVSGTPRQQPRALGVSQST